MSDITTVEVGIFPDRTTYYISADCSACAAENYITLWPGIREAACWRCGQIEPPPEQLDHQLHVDGISAN